MTVTLTKQYHALGLLWKINDNSCWHKTIAISIRLLIISRFSRTLFLSKFFYFHFPSGDYYGREPGLFNVVWPLPWGLLRWQCFVQIRISRFCPHCLFIISHEQNLKKSFLSNLLPTSQSYFPYLPRISSKCPILFTSSYQSSSDQLDQDRVSLTV
jgi:hypothetical protein